MIDGWVINGRHTLAQRMKVHDAKVGDRIIANYRHGPYGWYVSVDGKPCEMYWATEEEAQTVLDAVLEALR